MALYLQNYLAVHTTTRGIKFACKANIHRCCARQSRPTNDSEDRPSALTNNSEKSVPNEGESRSLSASK
jgi:hypothetical protein